jgi:hypothetical protein
VEGQNLLEKVSARLNVPVAMVAGMPGLKASLPESMQAVYFPFTPIMKPDWLVDTDA